MSECIVKLSDWVKRRSSSELTLLTGLDISNFAHSLYPINLSTMAATLRDVSPQEESERNTSKHITPREGMKDGNRDTHLCMRCR